MPTCLFVDIGGVILTNGWDRHARQRFVVVLDLGQTPGGRIAYLKNTPPFLEIAVRLGLSGLLHTSLSNMRNRLAALGW